MVFSLIPWLKRRLTGTRLEATARQIYLRMNLTKSGRYDREALSVMNRCLYTHSNCIDVGAYRGSFLREMVRRAPQGKHYAFEPAPAEAAYLVKAFPGVTVFPLALSQSAGQADFSYVVNRPTTSGFKPLRPPAPGEQVLTIQVQTDTLDHLLPPDLRIDFIKVDVEGAEFQVFAGAEQTLRRCRPVIIFEHGRASQRLYGIPSATIFQFLHGTCGLNLFLMRRWLDNRPPLSQAEFIDEVEYIGSYYFLACG